MSEGVILETRNLTKSFEGLVAVNSVSVGIREGELVAIIGPNGAGKTTLVNLVIGRIQPTSGQIFFKGEDITNLPPHVISRKGVVSAFQLTNIFPKMTAYDSIWLAAQSRNKNCFNPMIDRSKLSGVAEKVEETLRVVGLSDLADEVVSNLPYGSQKLLDIGITLATDPLILILDEPFAGVGQEDIGRIVQVLRELSRSKTIVFIEHIIDIVMKLAQRIIVLDRGQVIATGPPQEVSSDAKVQEVYLGMR